MRSYSGLGVPGAGIGADRMFLLDPQMGKRRRAVFRDKTVNGLLSCPVATTSETQKPEQRKGATTENFQAHIRRRNAR